MAIARTFFHAAPVDVNVGQALLQITDAQNGGPPGWEVQATANDNGSVVDLSLDLYEEAGGAGGPGYIGLLAVPVGVGAAGVTITTQDGGTNVQSGTLICTVTLGGNGKLQAAWTSGTITLH